MNTSLFPDNNMIYFYIISYHLGKATATGFRWLSFRKYFISHLSLRNLHLQLPVLMFLQKRRLLRLHFCFRGLR